MLTQIVSPPTGGHCTQRSTEPNGVFSGQVGSVCGGVLVAVVRRFGGTCRCAPAPGSPGRCRARGGPRARRNGRRRPSVRRASFPGRGRTARRAWSSNWRISAVRSATREAAPRSTLLKLARPGKRKRPAASTSLWTSEIGGGPLSTKSVRTHRSRPSASRLRAAESSAWRIPTPAAAEGAAEMIATTHRPQLPRDQRIRQLANADGAVPSHDRSRSLERFSSVCVQTWMAAASLRLVCGVALPQQQCHADAGEYGTAQGQVPQGIP